VQNRIEGKGSRNAGFFFIGMLLYAFDIFETLAPTVFSANFCS
jgi:hypothetical protein